MLAIYVSANSFLVSGDASTEFVAGRRVKADCGADGIKYSTVSSSTFSSPNTTVVINEAVLTSNLATVLYGIINIGTEGSLPDHTHSGSEGQGGQIDFDDIINKVIDFNDLINNDINFLQLTDTPTTYSGAAGAFVKTTTSGLEFVDEFVSKVKTFLDLDDTPTTYSGSTGKYLRVTASGVEFTDLETSTVPGAYIYELIDTITVSGTTLNATLSGIQDDRLLLDYSMDYNITSGAARLKLRFNNDSATNSYHYDYTAMTPTVTAGVGGDTTSIELGYANSSGSAVGFNGISQVFLDGSAKSLLAEIATRGNFASGGYRLLRYQGNWNTNNTAVTSLNFYTDAAATGYVKVYAYRELGQAIVAANTSNEAYGEIYRTTSKSLTAIDTWYTIEFDTNGVLKNVTHSESTNTDQLTVVVSGVYEVSYEIQVRRNSGNRHLIGRLTNNSSEIIGSASTIAMISTDVNDNKTLHSNVITTLSSGDVISVEIGTNILYPSEIDVYTGTNLPLASQNIYAKLRLKKLSDGV